MSSSSGLARFSILEPFQDRLDHGVSNRFTEHHQQCDVQAVQVHGVDYRWVSSATESPVAAVDALLTKTPRLRLRVGISDCTPLVIYDTQHHVGGVVHAGFKGTVHQIVPNVLSQLDPTQCVVGIGPAVGPCCYDNIDIQLENKLQLLDCGVPEQQIEVMRVCTRCHHDTYYSYRVGDRTNFGIYFELK